MIIIESQCARVTYKLGLLVTNAASSCLDLARWRCLGVENRCCTQYTQCSGSLQKPTTRPKISSHMLQRGENTRLLGLDQVDRFWSVPEKSIASSAESEVNWRKVQNMGGLNSFTAFLPGRHLVDSGASVGHTREAEALAL